MSAPVLHLILAIFLVAGYVTLTAIGQDANALLGVLVGQAAGVGIEQVSK